MYYPDMAVAYCERGEDVAAGADALVLLTHWDEYLHIDWAGMAATMRRPVLFDGRNLLDPKEMRGLGYTYMGVGRP